MRRTNCSSCGSHGLHTFLDLGMSPIADAYTATVDEVSPTHPLQLAVCTGCWLVQLLEVVPDLFGTGYSFYSSASAPLSEYHRKYARQVIVQEQELIGSRKPFLVEIGCNDGDFLRHFQHIGWRMLGVDPAIGPVKVAQERGLPVMGVPFTRRVAAEIKDEYGSADIIVANHVLAHVEDVGEVMAGIADLLAPEGVAYIEVQYLPDLLVNNAFDLVYHEHRNFFSLTSLAKAAGRWGLHVRDFHLTDRQGGSLRVKLGKRVAQQHHEKHWGMEAQEGWLRYVTAYDGMQGRAERIAHRLNLMIHEELGAGRRVAGYGAPAKATTLLNFAEIDASMVEYVTDTTEAKQGRFIPGTGIEIRPAHQDNWGQIDTFLLLAWNYAGPIMRWHRTDSGGRLTTPGPRWIVPIPSPVLL